MFEYYKEKLHVNHYWKLKVEWMIEFVVQTIV